MQYGFPLLIGGVIAAGSISQDNVGGAIFAVAAGAVIALVQYIRARRARRASGR